MSAMSSEHVMAGTIVNAISGRHALLCFRLNSEMHWTNRHTARHPPTVPNQARHITFTTTDHFIISPMPLVKILPYMDRIVRHWFVLHSKISFNTVKPCAPAKGIRWRKYNQYLICKYISLPIYTVTSKIDSMFCTFSLFAN